MPKSSSANRQFSRFISRMKSEAKWRFATAEVSVTSKQSLWASSGFALRLDSRPSMKLSSLNEEPDRLTFRVAILASAEGLSRIHASTSFSRMVTKNIRSLSLTRGESTWLRGNTFYGKRQMFRPDFMEWFENLQLPPYHLEKHDGQYELTFEGSWPEVMLWEIPALAVLMELRGRAVLHDMKRFELQVLYARGMTKLWEKIERLQPLDGLRIADFGTRRRHSYLWQDWCVQAMTEGLGAKFTGTSNCHIAMQRDLEAVGTNAHELPMIYSALAETDDELAEAPYDVLRDWHEEHDGNLRIILPDTYGSKGFLDRAPDWLASWTGIRIDSGDPATGAEIAIDWWKSKGEDPRKKLVIFSDGLDTDKIIELHQQFSGRVRTSFGWGTLLTNDFRGLTAGDALAPFSLVCKAVSANGHPTVKLSDNPNKAMGPADEIARYKRVFHVGKQERREVVV